jgi:hypothetical protein
VGREGKESRVRVSRVGVSSVSRAYHVVYYEDD